MKDESKWCGKLGICREVFGNPKLWLVTETLIFISKEHGFSVEINPGLVTDMTSVPRAFWWYVSPAVGLHAPAALIHDGMYASHYTNRELADKVFLEALLSLGVRVPKCYAMYRSVRSFGDKGWNKKINVIDHWREYVKIRGRHL